MPSQPRQPDAFRQAAGGRARQLEKRAGKPCADKKPLDQEKPCHFRGTSPARIIADEFQREQRCAAIDEPWTKNSEWRIAGQTAVAFGLTITGQEDWNGPKQGPKARRRSGPASLDIAGVRAKPTRGDPPFGGELRTARR